MSMSVCLSARISPQPHARSLPILLYMLPMSVARCSSDKFTIGRITYHREGVFFPIYNAYIFGATRSISLPIFLCMLPISEALSFSDMFTIGRIAYRRVFHFSSPLKMHYRRERGDRSTQHERSVIYDCFVTFRVSRRRREMYCGHARLCVCLSVRGRMPTLLHGPGCNLGEW